MRDSAQAVFGAVQRAQNSQFVPTPSTPRSSWRLGSGAGSPPLAAAPPRRSSSGPTRCSCAAAPCRSCSSGSQEKLGPSGAPPTRPPRQNGETRARSVGGGRNSSFRRPDGAGGLALLRCSFGDVLRGRRGRPPGAAPVCPGQDQLGLATRQGRRRQAGGGPLLGAEGWSILKVPA